MAREYPHVHLYVTKDFFPPETHEHVSRPQKNLIIVASRTSPLPVENSHLQLYFDFVNLSNLLRILNENQLLVPWFVIFSPQKSFVDAHMTLRYGLLGAENAYGEKETFLVC